MQQYACCCMLICAQRMHHIAFNIYEEHVANASWLHGDDRGCIFGCISSFCGRIEVKRMRGERWRSTCWLQLARHGCYGTRGGRGSGVLMQTCAYIWCSNPVSFFHFHGIAHAHACHDAVCRNATFNIMLNFMLKLPFLMRNHMKFQGRHVQPCCEPWL